MKSIYRGLAEQVYVETLRLILRPKKMNDDEEIFAFVSDPEVARFAFPKVDDIDQTREYIAESMKAPLGKFAICLKENRQVIGVIDFLEMDIHARVASVGYTISRPFWNREFATEALQKVLEIAFEQVGFLKITAEHDVRNPASGKVMKKSGMFQKNTVKKQDKLTKKIEEFVQFEITKSEYFAQKRKLEQEKIALY